MKKLFALVMAVAMMLSVAACGSSKPAAPAAPAASGQAAAAPAPAAEWKAKNVQMLVAAKAGGGTDVVGRIIAQSLANVTGKSAVIVNQTEGGGAVCFNNVETSGANGDIIGFFIPTYMTGYISGTHETDPMKDVKCAIALECLTGSAFVTVSANSPFKTIDELAAHIKANPGKVTMGTQLGSKSHYQLAEWCSKAGLDVKFVESGSDSDKVTGLMGNLYDVSSINGNQVNQYVASGDLRALVALEGYDGEALPSLKGLPTLKEAGFEPIGTSTSFLLCVSNAVPDSVAAEINAAVAEALKNEETVKQIANAGYVLKAHDVAGSAEFYKATWDAYYSVADLLGVKAEGR